MSFWTVHSYTNNLHKRHARIELIPRICIMYGPMKVLALSWLWWSREMVFTKVRGTRKEHKARVKTDVALWRKAFPKQ